MTLTLQIKNADENLLKALKGVINLHPEAKLSVKKEDITANGYASSFEKEIINDLKEIDGLRRDGRLKIYASIKEAFIDEGII